MLPTSRIQRPEDTLISIIQFVSPFLHLHDLASVFYSCKSCYSFSLDFCISDICHSKFITWKRFYRNTGFKNQIKSLRLSEVNSIEDMLEILDFVVDKRDSDSNKSVLSNLSIAYTGPFEIAEQSNITTLQLNSLDGNNKCSIRSFSFIASNLNKLHVSAFTNPMSYSLQSLHLSGVMDWSSQDLFSLLSSLSLLESLKIENVTVSLICLPLSLSNLRILSITGSLTQRKFDFSIHSPLSRDILATEPNPYIPCSMPMRSPLQLQSVDLSSTCITLESIHILLTSQCSLHTLILNSCRSMKGDIEFRSPSLRTLSLAYCSRIRSIRLVCPGLIELNMSQCLSLEHADIISCWNLTSLRVALTKLPVHTILSMFPFAQFD